MGDVVALWRTAPGLDVPALLREAARSGVRVTVVRAERDEIARWTPGDWGHAHRVVLLRGAGHAAPLTHAAAIAGVVEAVCAAV
jgi:pimeloyl-ACP methyl ester carboxylesterase